MMKDSEPILADSARDSSWDEKIKAARSGDDGAFGVLFDQYRGYLESILRQEIAPSLRSKFGASDVVQDSMLEAIQDFPKFRGSSEKEFRVWIAKLVRHNLVDQSRRFSHSQRRDVSREVAMGSNAGLLPDQKSEMKSSAALRRLEADQELRIAIDRLSHREREIIRLRHRDGKSYKQIAADLELSEVAARKLWSRSIVSLRRLLANRRPFGQEV